MQTFRWKSLSSLDGSERTFRERVRTPDAKFPYFLTTLAVFLPIGFGILMIAIAVLPLLTVAFLGSQSWVTYWVSATSSYALKLITYAVVLSFLGTYGLRAYIALKLRRQKREFSEKG
jgi:hypothetical protein